MERVYGIFKEVGDIDVLVINEGVFSDYDQAELKLRKIGKSELFIRSIRFE